MRKILVVLLILIVAVFTSSPVLASPINGTWRIESGNWQGRFNLPPEPRNVDFPFDSSNPVDFPIQVVARSGNRFAVLINQGNGLGVFFSEGLYNHGTNFVSLDVEEFGPLSTLLDFSQFGIKPYPDRELYTFHLNYSPIGRDEALNASFELVDADTLEFITVNVEASVPSIYTLTLTRISHDGGNGGGNNNQNGGNGGGDGNQNNGGGGGGCNAGLGGTLILALALWGVRRRKPA